MCRALRHVISVSLSNTFTMDKFALKISGQQVMSYDKNTADGSQSNFIIVYRKDYHHELCIVTYIQTSLYQRQCDRGDRQCLFYLISSMSTYSTNISCHIPTPMHTLADTIHRTKKTAGIRRGMPAQPTEAPLSRHSLHCHRNKTASGIRYGTLDAMRTGK